MVELRDVHMQFEEKNVLEGVSLDVQPQERLVITRGLLIEVRG
jgi:ABC-type transporter Mla maintaining outer membrane lipid asymmetry ATPase subunit MlaF